MFGVMALSVKQTIIDHHDRRYEVNQFARWQHTQVRPRVSTSVAITVYTHVCQGTYHHLRAYYTVSHQAVMSYGIDALY